MEDNHENTLSQSSATKINTKWAVKLSYGESPVVCFVFNKLEQKKDEEDNLSAALTGFRNSIERHLNKNGITLKISNFKSFKTAAKFTTAIRINRRAGKENVQHKPVIEATDFVKIRATRSIAWQLQPDS